ncbi:MAG: alpha/beta hydrolase [Chloroflexota bacterium]
MSTITTDQGIVHYEVFGRGRPVILLHGWLGSWGLWHKTMTGLHGQYRTYALDFWGFGESGKKRETYNISDFVGLVDQFMEQLGIVQAPMIGHSMGGTVSLAFTIKHPEKVSKVGVIGSPVDGESLAFLLKLAGKPLIAKLVHNALWALKLGIRSAAPFITKDKRWYEMISADLSQTTTESFLLSIKSLRSTDLTEQLSSIQVPVMGIFGAKDNIVNPNQKDVVLNLAQQPHVNFFENAGHFPMLDDPELFLQVVKDFLDVPLTPPQTP